MVIAVIAVMAAISAMKAPDPGTIAPATVAVQPRNGNRATTRNGATRWVWVNSASWSTAQRLGQERRERMLEDGLDLAAFRLVERAGEGHVEAEPVEHVRVAPAVEMIHAPAPTRAPGGGGRALASVSGARNRSNSRTQSAASRSSSGDGCGRHQGQETVELAHLEPHVDTAGDASRTPRHRPAARRPRGPAPARTAPSGSRGSRSGAATR